MIPLLLLPEMKPYIQGLASTQDDDEQVDVLLNKIELSDQLQELPGSDANPTEHGGWWLTPNGTLLRWDGLDGESNYKLYRFSDANEFDPTADDWINWEGVKQTHGITAEVEATMTPGEKLQACTQYHSPENWDSYPLEIVRGEDEPDVEDTTRIRYQLYTLLNLQVANQ